MKFNIKKVLVSGAALLMLSTTGAGIASSNQSNVHASSKTNRITYLQRRKTRDYNDIKSINNQLNKLQGKRVKRVGFFKNTKKAKKVHHESLATWYANNGKRLYKRYINTNKLFRKGWQSGNGHFLNTDYTNNRYYRNGWITGTTYDNDNNHFGTRTNYKHSLNVYKQGLIYAKNNHTNHIDYDFSSDGVWNTDNN